ncbi:MAG: replicative DNA helicase [Candidatus Spechtbacterales bacterium]|nr:replicative DNA helicase [Candidatus Spechtbacterales bacterium]
MAGNQKIKNIDRLPPQDIEAEQSVLGSILMDKEAFFRVIDVLHPNDFYVDAHRRVFETMTELSEKGQPLDILSVSSKLKEKSHLENIGGKSTLTQMVNSVPSSAHVTHYANIVHKKSVLRKLIESSHAIGQLGYKEEEDVEVLLDEAERHIFNISERMSSQSFASLKGDLGQAFERIDKLHKNTGEIRGVSTGFTDLDNYLSGMQKSDLVILAARPSLGKSSLALDIARNAAANNKVPVGIFSLEMSRDQVVDRMLAAEAGVDLWRLRTGKLSSSGEYNDFVKIQDALGSLSEAPVYIDDGLTSSVLQMRAMARRLQAERGLGLLIVDYLQLIQPKTSSDSMVQQITEISRSLKALARELNIPVLALSQLSRAVEQRPDKTPKLSDLRDSGSIEQDADVVLFIARDPRDPDDHTAEIHIAKHRNGPIGKIQLFFDRKSATFKSLDKHHTGPNNGEVYEYPGNDVGEDPREDSPEGDDITLDDIPS